MIPYLAAEREHGTLLRAKAIPNGMRGYFVGKLITVSGTILAYLVIIVVPGPFILDGPYMDDVCSWRSWQPSPSHGPGRDLRHLPSHHRRAGSADPQLTGRP
ncbi:hypothetical protein [Specibacter cremeus]|uniref:hypothetical protein n=1 Tax=Specibacter cremeus TaxID=1629051 RepID=UPI000F77271F|nr:hypothetical protein [Specibacter cremeus]